jgi:integrase
MAGLRKKEWITSKGVKKHSWEITYTLNGKPYRKSGFKTRQDAQNAMPKVTKQYDSNTLFHVLAEDFIERHCSLHCGEGTQDLYKSYIKVNINLIKYKKLKDIEKRDISDLILQWVKEGKANKTINNIMAFIGSVFKFGIEYSITSSNPCAGLKPLKKEDKEMNFLNEEEINLFIEKAIDSPFFALFYTAIFTGMRRGELLAVEWSDINFNKMTIDINKQLYRKKIQPPKNKSYRIIDMSPSLAEVLKEHKKKSSVLSKIVFCDQRGNYTHPYNMTKRYFKPILKAMATDIEKSNPDNCLDKIRFHDLRHTHASVLLSNGAPIKFVQERLGHSKCSMTVNVYNHITQKATDKSVIIIDSILKNEHKMSMKFEKT